MGKPFTPERLANIRRMRKARRLYRKQPLFAYLLMLGSYPDYSYDDFLDDLRYRKPPKRRKSKSGLMRYGRYFKMVEFAQRYLQTRNAEDGLKARQLRERMTKPYRVMVKIEGYRLEYGFSPLIPLAQIEELVRELNTCTAETHADELVERFRKTAHI